MRARASAVKHRARLLDTPSCNGSTSARPAFEYDDDDPAGFRSGMHRFGKQVGAEQTGTSLYDLPPGQALCPYHYEYAEEEWLLVVSGRPTVRDPDGAHELSPTTSCSSSADPPARTRSATTPTSRRACSCGRRSCTPAATVYPDSDKIAIWTGNPDDDLIAPRSAGVDYFHGETNSAGTSNPIGRRITRGSNPLA